MNLYVATAALGVLGLLIARSIFLRDRDKHSPIDLNDLLIGDDGRLSKAACVMLGAFVLTTWQMIVLTLDGKMTEGYFLGYGALWITPSMARLVKSEPAPSPPKE